MPRRTLSQEVQLSGSIHSSHFFKSSSSVFLINELNFQISRKTSARSSQNQLNWVVSQNWTELELIFESCFVLDLKNLRRLFRRLGHPKGCRWGCGSGSGSGAIVFRMSSRNLNGVIFSSFAKYLNRRQNWETMMKTRLKWNEENHW